MKNIELFDAYAGYALERMYQKFPLCVDFIPKEEIARIDGESGDDTERRTLVFCATLLWLERNGFLRIALSEPTNRNAVVPMVYHQFICVELTIDGLNLLRSPTPKSISKKSVGDDIIDKVKSGLFTEAGRIATRAMFEYGIKKAIGEV